MRLPTQTPGVKRSVGPSLVASDAQAVTPSLCTPCIAGWRECCGFTGCHLEPC